MKTIMKKLLPLLVLIVLIISLTACTPNTEQTTEPPSDTSQGNAAITTEEPWEDPDSETLTVHFIDVGQGDSILIQSETAAMLIDGGTYQAGNKIVRYLKAEGINKLDYLVATHPHADHIGGLNEVVQSFDIGKVVMPEVTHTTRTYEDFLVALQKKGLKITLARAGMEWELSPEVTCQVLSPGSDNYYELNDYSVVIKVAKGNTAFLFTGDAGNPAEQQMLSQKLNLKSDVLKVGHHGSRHSTSHRFLEAVAPQYAVISLGANNEYGHPHEETLRRLKGIQILRTDLNGTIVFTSDGNHVSVKKEKNHD